MFIITTALKNLYRHRVRYIICGLFLLGTVSVLAYALYYSICMPVYMQKQKDLYMTHINLKFKKELQWNGNENTISTVTGFNSYNFINSMTAIENVEIPMGYKGMNKKDRTERAASLLEQVGVSNRLKHLPCNMSGGEQQRVAIARALANNPLLILADEPTGNLDEKTTGEIMNLLKELNQNGTTVIMVTHNTDMLEYATRKITISKGEILQD